MVSKRQKNVTKIVVDKKFAKFVTKIMVTKIMVIKFIVTQICCSHKVYKQLTDVTRLNFFEVARAAFFDGCYSSKFLCSSK